MKKIKFKPRFNTLAMRIWTIFTVIILIIVFSISILYVSAFSIFSEKAKMQDLKVSHDILLQSKKYNEPNRFDEMKNLKGSDHFVLRLEAGKIILPDFGHGPRMLPPELHDEGFREWVAGFITGKNMHEKQFTGKYKKKRVMFIISSINNDDGTTSYLISYMPDFHDNTILWIVVITGAVFIVVGFIAAKIAAARISKPLKELEKYTVRIAHKDWKEPIVVRNKDEIGKLADAMNRMQNELKRADEEEKMFLQSISHDLKTPVMVIMSHAEAIIDGVYIDSVEDTAEIIKDEAEVLEKKIKKLLYLNTLDYVLENNSENSTINLKDMLFNIINRFELINSEVQWEMDIDEVYTTGNEEKIKVALENIVDNGLRYAEKQLGITLKLKGGRAVIEIYNDGPHIKGEKTNHIFEKFYKDKKGNFGLGLTITKKIIDFYNGQIEAVNREKGVSFIITLPAK